VNQEHNISLTVHQIEAIILIVHVSLLIAAISINPADPAICQDKVVPELDRTKHRHAIEDNHCYLCEADV
jgi:hypothetical protein